MSETGTQGKPEQAWVGSRRWFWRMRLINVTLFTTPFVVLLVAVSGWQMRGTEDPSLFARLVHAVPWVFTAAAVGTLSHALWRIMVNLETSHPFTKKDDQVLQRALWIQMAMGLAVILGGFIAVPTYMMLADIEPDSVRYVDAAYGPLAVAAVTAMLTSAVQVMYKRARRYFEELEKGV